MKKILILSTMACTLLAHNITLSMFTKNQLTRLRHQQSLKKKNHTKIKSEDELLVGFKIHNSFLKMIETVNRHEKQMDAYKQDLCTILSQNLENSNRHEQHIKMQNHILVAVIETLHKQEKELQSCKNEFKTVITAVQDHNLLKSGEEVKNVEPKMQYMTRYYNETAEKAAYPTSSENRK